MNKGLFYCCPINPGLLELDPDQAHHLKQVRRLKPGDAIELFDGRGTAALARVSKINRKAVLLEVEKITCHQPPKSRRIVIVAALAKGERFDWLISKCTEIGVNRICPVRFERTIKLAGSSKSSQRYENLAISAAKQCHRWFLPQIDPPAQLDQAVQILSRDYPDAQMLFGEPTEKTDSILHYTNCEKDLICFVGPEGGFTNTELELLHQHHAQPVRLTETILRVETAAITFAAVLCCTR
ncbi:MAG: 16S rRNA (uracil(1498)-N(3))-methyltransferase [Sedimentisphaerales bacterium]|nr:16S rRNA (uracil(1498)-N(3))-methyltransferase [Sedimentisphaerales bacterium]